MQADSLLLSSRAAVLSAVVAILVGASPLAAQTPEAQPAAANQVSAALALTCDVSTAGLDAEALRAAIERELTLPVRLVAPTSEGTPQAHLAIDATTQAAVNLTFVRADGSKIERTVDVSNSGGHADETLALVTANLMRDEAADLLDALRAAQPAAPQPTAAPAPPPLPPVPKGCEPNNLRKRHLGFDLVPYLGSSTNDKLEVEREFSINLFGGMTGAVRGFELGGFLNLEDHSVCGFQMTGGANIVNGPVQGVQLGLFDWANSRVDGAQFGLITGALGSLKGVQWSMLALASGDILGAQFGLLDIGGGSLTGAQIGTANLAAADVEGAQMGVANFAGGAVSGAQLGIANVAAGGMSGAQIAVANVSGSNTKGLQLGVANVSAGRVDGAMIGVVNVASDADAPIGLVNVLWNGRTHLDLWGSDFGLFAVGIEHGGRYLHNIYGFGITPRDGRAVFAPIYGIGGRVVETSRWFVDVDALGHWLFVHDSAQDEIDYSFIGTLRVPISYRFTSGFALFVSPALNVSWSDTKHNLIPDPSLLGGARLTKRGADNLVRMWPGFSIGARFF